MQRNMESYHTHKNILLVGVPRSGSSWMAKVLAQSADSVLVREPDNERRNLRAYRAKRKWHRMPYLSANASVPAMERFWQRVFCDALIPKNAISRWIQHCMSQTTFVLSRRHIRWKIIAAKRKDLETHRHRIVKSVHAGLSLAYLQQHFDPQIVLIFRHPANVISSYLRLNLPDADRAVYRQAALTQEYLLPYWERIESTRQPLARMGMQIAIFYAVWEQQLRQNPSWLTVTHENLCLDPLKEYRNLFANLALEWSERVENYLHEHNRRGTGYETRRIAADEIHKWKRELTAEQIQSIQNGYSIIPLEHYHEFQL